MRPSALALVVLLAAPALAGELASVTMKDSIEVAGKTLKLNGMGVRKSAFVAIYVGGLYLETASADAATVISADEVKRVQLTFLLPLGKERIAKAIEEGFERNAKEQLPALKERLATLAKFIPDAAKGDEILITYLPGNGPGNGIEMTIGGVAKAAIPGKDFADALFSVWLGASPVDERLKTGLLGKKP